MEIYSLYSKKIIETKIEQWKNLLSKSLEKDTLLDYHLELSNEALGIIAKYEATNSSNLRNVRNNIVHPYSTKGICHELLEKIIEKNFYQNIKKEKYSEVLIVNIGNANNYELVRYEKQNLETRFSFKILIEDNKFEKILVVKKNNNAIAIDDTLPITEPSIDLFGLIFGESLFFPNFIPPKYAKLSVNQIVSNKYATWLKLKFLNINKQ